MAIDGASISVMQAEFYDAMAVGDRVRAAGILKRLYDALKDVDPDTIKKVIGFITTIIDFFDPAPQPIAASSDAIVALSPDDAQAAGILTNPQLWLNLGMALFELFRRFRGEIAGQVLAQAAADSEAKTDAKSHKKHKEE